MTDFASAAFPWVAAGIALAIYFVKYNSKKDIKNNKDK